MVKNLPAMQEMRGQEDPLEKEMATHSSILFFFSTPLSSPEKTHGQRSLTGYIVHGVAKDSDMT